MVKQQSVRRHKKRDNNAFEDEDYLWLEITLDVFRLLILFGVLVLLLKQQIEPKLYDMQKQTAVNASSDPVILDGFSCRINQESFSMPLHEDALIDSGILDADVVAGWDTHQEYILDTVYKDYYQISGVMAYANGFWYTKEFVVDLTSVQAEKNVFGINGVLLNYDLGSVKHDFLTRSKDSGVYKIYYANAETGLEIPESVVMYVDSYTDIVTTIEYYYNKNIKLDS